MQFSVKKMENFKDLYKYVLDQSSYLSLT